MFSHPLLRMRKSSLPFKSRVITRQISELVVQRPFLFFSKLRLLFFLSSVSFILISSATESGLPAENKSLKVLTRREGDVTRLLVENHELAEMTVTFDVRMVNMKANVKFPFTATFPPQQTSEAFTLAVIDPDVAWEYTYTNYYKLGSYCAAHDDSYVYSLPYAAGSAFRVSQGYNGGFSHKGSNQYAIDWKMPSGTAVCAARGGLVVKIKDDSETGGDEMKYDCFNNYVLVRHDDATLGHYCHLLKNGVKVKPGERISAGQVIAFSGNTGFSSGPHLHFSVFKTKNGRERQSLPVKFKTSSELSASLTTGKLYRAVEQVFYSASAITSEPKSQTASQ